MTQIKRIFRCSLLSSIVIGTASFFNAAYGQDTVGGDALIPVSIIIDDIGDHYNSGKRAINLPGPVTYAFLPHTPHSKQLADSAFSDGKEIMIHMPMQSMTERRLGPGGLTLEMTHSEFDNALHAAIEAVPHAKGLNNHMGSLLTRHPGHMAWLMDGLKQYKIDYFIDSRTTHHTVAQQLAGEHGVPTRRRDVFLDDNPSPEAIAEQFQRLISVAQKKGQAIAIGHPYESTLTLLEEMIPKFEQLGLKLVPVSHLITSIQTTPTDTNNTTAIVLHTKDNTTQSTN